MSIISNWENSGGLRIRLELPSKQFCCGEPLTGLVRVESMTSRRVALQQVSLSLNTHEGGYSPSHLIAEQVLIERDDLLPLCRRSYPFTFSLPEDASIGDGWINACALFGIFKSVSVSVEVMVAPVRLLTRVVEVAATIAHHEIAQWCAVGDTLIATLRPKWEVEERVFGIRVALSSNGQEVSGTVTVTVCGAGLLRMLPGARRSYPFRIGDRGLDGARSDFEAILLPYVSDLGELPIPARPSVSVRNLLLPSNREEEA